MLFVHSDGSFPVKVIQAEGILEDRSFDVTVVSASIEVVRVFFQSSMLTSDKFLKRFPHLYYTFCFQGEEGGSHRGQRILNVVYLINFR